MKRIQRYRMAACLGAALLLLLAVGCKEYRINVALNEDGSGTREERLTMATLAEGDTTITLEKFVRLFTLGEKFGWKLMKTPTEADGKKTGKYEFVRMKTADSPGDWMKLSGGITIRGNTSEDPFDKRDVRFTNSIEVGIDESAGTKTYTYRERFSWKSLLEVVAAFKAADFRSAMAEAYPSLNPQDLAELEGLMKATVYTLLFAEASGDETKLDEKLFAAGITRAAEEIVRKSVPEADIGRVEEITHDAVADPEEKLDTYLRLQLPGVYLSIWSEIELSVTMPGRIIESNADEVEGQTASWTLEIMKPIIDPVEIFVRSEVE